MKKKIKIAGAIAALMASTSICVNAQYTTTAKPISNGCGSEKSGIGGKVLTPVGNAIDNVRTGTAHKPSCDQHDKDYYNGVPKDKADREFRERSPTMGWAVQEHGGSTAQKSYKEAQEDRRTSQQLQSTWEKEHQQSLDASNYKVEKDNTGEFLKKNGLK